MATLTIHNFLGRGGVNGVGWESVQEPADDDRGRQRLCAPTGISMQHWTSERISTLRPNDQLGANPPPPAAGNHPSAHNFTFFQEERVSQSRLHYETIKSNNDYMVRCEILHQSCVL